MVCYGILLLSLLATTCHQHCYLHCCCISLSNRYNDGLDKWRFTASEVRDEFAKKGADVVYAFQTRNPTHAGHAYLMRTAGEKLLAQVKYYSVL
jgi:ATP sulfurylase